MAHAATDSAVADTVTSEPASTTLTERMFNELARNHRLDAQAGGAGGSTTLEDLRNMDKIWHKLRNAPRKPSGDAPAVVTTSKTPLGRSPGLDVIICGGTLGIFLATALQRNGVKVAVVERGPLKGRAQEWNVSRAEMQSLVELGVFDESDLEKVLGLEFNPVRVGFKVSAPTRSFALVSSGHLQDRRSLQLWSTVV